MILIIVNWMMRKFPNIKYGNLIKIEICLRYYGKLNNWEVWFMRNIKKKYYRLTVKQTEMLNTIWKRISLYRK